MWCACRRVAARFECMNPVCETCDLMEKAVSGAVQSALQRALSRIVAAGSRRPSASTAFQCVVASRPARRPAAARTREPVHTESRSSTSSFRSHPSGDVLPVDQGPCSEASRYQQDVHGRECSEGPARDHDKAASGRDGTARFTHQAGIEEGVSGFVPGADEGLEGSYRIERLDILENMDRNDSHRSWCLTFRRDCRTDTAVSVKCESPAGTPQSAANAKRSQATPTGERSGQVPGASDSAGADANSDIDVESGLAAALEDAEGR